MSVLLGSILKQNAHALSDNVNEMQDFDIWSFKTVNFKFFIHFYSSKVCAYDKKLLNNLTQYE